MGANERQIGGSHYTSEYQHWDWVVDTKQNYHQGCATAYISRHRRKNGKEDLEKALHYIDKMQELKPQRIPFQAKFFWAFMIANELNLLEGAALWAVLDHDWESARLYVNRLVAATSP